MSTPGSRALATGLSIMLISAGVGVNFGAAGGLGPLLSFTGVLVGANLVAVGVRMAEHAAPIAGVGAREAFLRRNIAVVGLIIASSAITAASGGGEPGQLLWFVMFVFLLGLSLINMAVLEKY